MQAKIYTTLPEPHNLIVVKNFGNSRVHEHPEYPIILFYDRTGELQLILSLKVLLLVETIK